MTHVGGSYKIKQEMPELKPKNHVSFQSFSPIACSLSADGVRSVVMEMVQGFNV